MAVEVELDFGSGAWPPLRGNQTKVDKRLGVQNMSTMRSIYEAVTIRDHDNHRDPLILGSCMIYLSYTPRQQNIVKYLIPRTMSGRGHLVNSGDMVYLGHMVGFEGPMTTTGS